MLKALSKKVKNQKGFTLVELMVVVVIIGILAAIAIPKFFDTTAKANTSKVAADLRTIDSAISMYVADKGGTNPTDGLVSAAGLTNYLAATPTPPKGKAYIKGVIMTTDLAATYSISSGRAIVTGDTKLNHAEDYTTVAPAATPVTPPAE